MDKLCKWFACVYATNQGCCIKGYLSEEGLLNGNKKHCPHYNVLCINAKCTYCGHKNCECCKGVL